jgi:hypothetical protein
MTCMDVCALGIGKPDCVVVDVVDSFANKSLVTIPSLLGLDPDFVFEGPWQHCARARASSYTRLCLAHRQRCRGMGAWDRRAGRD